ncbi:MAG: hypothetical protein Kow0092_25380 [Deferrisomatales bacterium]
MLVLVGALTVKGAFRGFFREACGLLALAAGLGAAVLYGEAGAAEATARWGVPELVARPAARAALFLAPYVALQAVGFGLHRLGRAVFLGGLDRLGGAAVGAVTGALLAGVAVLGLERTGWGAQWVRHSAVARPAADALGTAWAWVQQYAPVELPAKGRGT